MYKMKLERRMTPTRSARMFLQHTVARGLSRNSGWYTALGIALAPLALSPYNNKRPKVAHIKIILFIGLF